MHTFQVTEKFQVRIPTEIRKVLDLHPGDSVVFEVKKGQVTLRKALPIDLGYARALEQTLSEWNSDADEEVYRQNSN